jgi:hypothetical protein
MQLKGFPPTRLEQIIIAAGDIFHRFKKFTQIDSLLCLIPITHVSLYLLELDWKLKLQVSSKAPL